MPSASPSSLGEEQRASVREATGFCCQGFYCVAPDLRGSGLVGVWLGSSISWQTPGNEHTAPALHAETRDKYFSVQNTPHFLSDNRGTQLSPKTEDGILSCTSFGVCYVIDCCPGNRVPKSETGNSERSSWVFFQMF